MFASDTVAVHSQEGDLRQEYEALMEEVSGHMGLLRVYLLTELAATRATAARIARRARCEPASLAGLSWFLRLPISMDCTCFFSFHCSAFSLTHDTLVHAAGGAAG